MNEAVIQGPYSRFKPPLPLDRKRAVWLGRNSARCILLDRFRVNASLDSGNLNADEDKAPEIIEKAFASHDDVKEFILRRQLSRRNLTDAARIKVTLQLKPLIEAKAKAKEADRKSKTIATSSTLPKSLPVIDTRKELAATAGVSEDSFRKADVTERASRLPPQSPDDCPGDSTGPATSAVFASASFTTPTICRVGSILLQPT